MFLGSVYPYLVGAAAAMLATVDELPKDQLPTIAVVLLLWARVESRLAKVEAKLEAKKDG